MCALSLIGGDDAQLVGQHATLQEAGEQLLHIGCLCAVQVAGAWAGAKDCAAHTHTVLAHAAQVQSKSTPTWSKPSLHNRSPRKHSQQRPPLALISSGPSWAQNIMGLSGLGQGKAGVPPILSPAPAPFWRQRKGASKQTH